jgi:hypothetical protein
VRPITIEQSTAKAKLAFEIHRNAQIDSVRLSRAQFHSRHPSELEGEGVKLDFGFRAEQRPSPSGVLRIAVSFRVSVEPAETVTQSSGRESVRGSKKATPSEEAPLAVEVGFETDYTLRDGFVPSDEAIVAFKDGNAIFNVWPYFREFLQSSTTRMGHPPLTAPFLKLRPKQEDKALSAPEVVPSGQKRKTAKVQGTAKPTAKK